MARDGQSQQLAYVEGDPTPVKRASTFSYIERGLIENPHGLATIVMHQKAHHLSELFTGEEHQLDEAKACLQWTYTQLHQAALKLVAGLTAHQVLPGMRLAVLIPNRVEFPLTLWMHYLLRLTLIPIDPGAVSEARREELSKLMAAFEPDVVMVLNDTGAQAIDDVYASRSPPRVKIVLEGPYNGWTTIPTLAADGIEGSINTEQLVQDARGDDDPDRTSLVFFTSGTSSGTPKGCPRHVAAQNHSFDCGQWAAGMHKGSRVLTSTPGFRVVAASIHGGIWYVGATGVMPDPSLGYKGTIAAIRQHSVNYVVFIPALMHAVVSDPEFEGLDVSSVEEIRIGGDICTRDLLSRTSKAFPSTIVAAMHGMTEGGAYFDWPFYHTPVDQIPYWGEISPLGRVMPGVKIRIIDPDTKEILRRNQPGELCAVSPSIIKHYLNHTNQNAFYCDDDGTKWFRTGDLGVINDDGLIYIVGRIKDIIKRSGVPITPAALESCIEHFTGSQTSVIAWPHTVLGQEPLVVLESLNGKTEEEIKEQVLRMFGPDYALGPIITLQQLGQGEFPLNTMGKIMKIDLHRMVKEYYRQST